MSEESRRMLEDIYTYTREHLLDIAVPIVYREFLR